MALGSGFFSNPGGEVQAETHPPRVRVLELVLVQEFVLVRGGVDGYPPPLNTPLHELSATQTGNVFMTIQKLLWLCLILEKILTVPSQIRKRRKKLNRKIFSKYLIKKRGLGL